MPKIIISIALSISTVLISFQSIADDVLDSTRYDMGVKTAKYYISSQLIYLISKSKCGYVFKKEIDQSHSLWEITHFLTDSDKKEYLRIIQSPEFKKDIRESYDNLFSQPLKIMIDENIDQRTSCGLMIGGQLAIHDQSKREWIEAREKYIETFGNSR